MADANPVEVQPGTTLLLACLEDTDRAALEEALGREFRLLFAKSACEALGTMRAQAPAAVLFNALSPDADALLGQQHRDEGRQSPLVFALVPRNDEDIQVAALEQGADGVILLPASPRLVRAHLENALRSRDAAAARSQETSDQLRFLNDASRYLLAGADPDDSIGLALDKTREYFEGDRAYVFEIDDERELASNTYECCAPGVAAEQQNLQDLPCSTYRRMLDILKAGESICLDGVEAILESGLDENRIFTSQGIESLILVPLRSGDHLVGFMGVDNPARNASHASHLAALGDYMTAILQRRDNEEQILRDNRVLRDLMNDMPGGFVQQLVTPEGRTVPHFINEEFCRMSGMSHRECTEFYSADGFTGVHPDDEEMARQALEKLITTRETITVRLRLIRGDGSYVPMQVFYRVTDDRDGNLLLSGYYTDLTEELAAKERAIAERDELTGLPNRTRLARMRTSVYQGLSSCGVLFFDVNHLKAVNDTQGHGRGDALLKLVSDSIRSITDERVHGYRYGGDEFLVVACDSDEAELAKLVERWEEHLGKLAETHDVVATAAVGSCWSKAPFTLNNLIKRADEAMYAEKRRVREHVDGQGGLTAGKGTSS